MSWLNLKTWAGRRPGPLFKLILLSLLILYPSSQASGYHGEMFTVLIKVTGRNSEAVRGVDVTLTGYNITSCCGPTPKLRWNSITDDKGLATFETFDGSYIAEVSLKRSILAKVDVVVDNNVNVTLSVDPQNPIGTLTTQSSTSELTLQSRDQGRYLQGTDLTPLIIVVSLSLVGGLSVLLIWRRRSR